MQANYEKDRSVLIPEQYFLLQIYLAQSYQNRKQYRKAAKHYKNSLPIRKSIVKSKNPIAPNYESLIEKYPDVEIRYQMALCHEAVNEFTEALNSINAGISNRQRSITINMMIGKYSIQLGKCANAATAYESVVRECPLALDAIKELLVLGYSDVEISALISESWFLMVLIFFYLVLKLVF